MYEVPTHRLNEAVKRNLKRFPVDFMFQLTGEEWKTLRSQFAIFSKDSRKYLPYAFTEHGILMLSSVLNSDKAIDINIQIMKIFVKMRQQLISQTSSNEQINELRRILMLHIENSDIKFAEHDEAILQIIDVLNTFVEKPPKTQQIGFTAPQYSQ